MSNAALAVLPGGAAPARTALSIQDMSSLGQIFYQSGFFTDVRQEAQAIVKIMAGQELGLAPFEAMQSLHIINGRPSLAANAMAAAVKANPRYDYRVLRLDDAACVIEFYQHGEAIGQSEFTIQQANKAGTKNTDKFPRNMLFARAMSNGVRWYCPDVFKSAVYTPEELGAEVDGEGNVLNAAVEGQALADTPALATQEQVDWYNEQLKVARDKGVRRRSGDDWPELTTRNLESVVVSGIKALEKALAEARDAAKKAQPADLHGTVHQVIEQASAAVDPEAERIFSQEDVDADGVIVEDAAETALLNAAEPKQRKKHQALILACGDAGLEWSLRVWRLKAINEWIAAGPYRDMGEISSTTELNDGQLVKLAADIKAGLVKWGVPAP